MNTVATHPAGSGSCSEGVCVHCGAVQTLTVFAEAAQLLILLPEDVLQPVGFVEVGETVQSTKQDCRQRAEELQSVDTQNFCLIG